MKNKFKNFNEFYHFYLSEHLNPICRGLHFLRPSYVIFVIINSFNNIKLLLLTPLFSYGFAWIGYFFFENQ